MSVKKLLQMNHTDKDKKHSYGNLYTKILSEYKIKAKNILEIGVEGGGSIKVWSEYFTNSVIHCADIKDCPAILNYKNNIKFYKDNAYTKEFIKENFADKNIKFDVIIDDGSHQKDDLCFVAENYTNLLTDNGIIILEDIPVGIRDKKNLSKALQYAEPEKGGLTWINDIVNSFPEELKNNIVKVDLRKEKLRFDDYIIYMKKN